MNEKGTQRAHTLRHTQTRWNDGVCVHGVRSMNTENSLFQSADIKLIRFGSARARTNCLLTTQLTGGKKERKTPGHPTGTVHWI